MARTHKTAQNKATMAEQESVAEGARQANLALLRAARTRLERAHAREVMQTSHAVATGVAEDGDFQECVEEATEDTVGEGVDDEEAQDGADTSDDAKETANDEEDDAKETANDEEDALGEDKEAVEEKEEDAVEKAGAPDKGGEGCGRRIVEKERSRKRPQGMKRTFLMSRKKGWSRFQRLRANMIRGRHWKFA